ncbi:MAG: hypothetical protein VW455_07670 [Nitrospinota bacterium]
MLFGEFLLGQGLVKEEDLMNALDEQQQNKMPMGQMAVQKGFLDSKGLFKILTEQRKRVREANDFGNLALEMGLLNQGQVDELIEAQNTTNELLGNLLVAKGALSRDKLVQVLRDYNTACAK